MDDVFKLQFLNSSQEISFQLNILGLGMLTFAIFDEFSVSEFFFFNHSLQGNKATKT